jgi:hypothetical protein
MLDLVLADDGVLVILRTWDDNGLTGRLLLDAPLHVIADRLWHFLLRVDRLGERGKQMIAALNLKGSCGNGEPAARSEAEQLKCAMPPRRRIINSPR